jgi:hypothetical protein
MPVGKEGVVGVLEELMANSDTAGDADAVTVSHLQREQLVRSPGSVLL